MTGYITELFALATYLETEFTDLPIIHDGHAGDVVTEESLEVEIDNLAVVQGTVGQGAGSNRIDHMGMLQLHLYLDAGVGTKIARGYLDTLETLFKEKLLTVAGVVATSEADVFIQTSPKGKHPYIGAKVKRASMTKTTFNVPFERYST